MKKRIEQLEGALKAQGQPAPMAANGPALSAEQAISPNEKTVSADRAQPKAAKAEPFAFADWTWLNGNARTKTPASIRSSSRPRFAPTSITSTISTIPRTTRSAGRARCFVRTKSR